MHKFYYAYRGFDTTKTSTKKKGEEGSESDDSFNDSSESSARDITVHDHEILFMRQLQKKVCQPNCGKGHSP